MATCVVTFCNHQLEHSPSGRGHPTASRDVISLVAKQANLKRPKAARETTELSLFTVRSILAEPMEPKDGDVKKKTKMVWY